MLTSKTAGPGSKHDAGVGTASETGTIRDLRDWLAVVERARQLKHVDGADWDLELGAIAHLNNRQGAPAALLFDRIKGYSPGFRILTGASNNPARLGITLRLGPNLSTADLVLAVCTWKAHGLGRSSEGVQPTGGFNRARAGVRGGGDSGRPH